MECLKAKLFTFQNVNDSYPPCKNKLRLESLCAQICSPFMGYIGLYENGQLLVTSNEPAAFAKRRPSGKEIPFLFAVLIKFYKYVYIYIKYMCAFVNSPFN